jgi:hypothetical protein
MKEWEREKVFGRGECNLRAFGRSGTRWNAVPTGVPMEADSGGVRAVGGRVIRLTPEATEWEERGQLARAWWGLNRAGGRAALR